MSLCGTKSTHFRDHFMYTLCYDRNAYNVIKYWLSFTEKMFPALVVKSAFYIPDYYSDLWTRNLNMMCANKLFFLAHRRLLHLSPTSIPQIDFLQPTRILISALYVLHTSTYMQYLGHFDTFPRTCAYSIIIHGLPKWHWTHASRTTLHKHMLYE